MKLSEAIRLGAMATDQGHGNGALTSTTKTCALGAALFAADVKCLSDCDAYLQLPRRWPILEQRVSLPFRTSHHSLLSKRALVEAVWILNDVDRWTREQIADWVETIERAQEQKEVVAEPQRVTA